jgi:hypothetical protein
MYKKRGRPNKDVESINNNEDQFATRFFNFMIKHLDIIISQVSIPQINLDIGTRFTPSSAGSAPDHQKYHVDDINELTPCALLYVIGMMLRTIEIANIIGMASRIIFGRFILSECAMVEVTTIREGCEFEDTDYLDEEEGVEKLKYVKGNFILLPHKEKI